MAELLSPNHRSDVKQNQSERELFSTLDFRAKLMEKEQVPQTRNIVKSYFIKSNLNISQTSDTTSIVNTPI